MLEGIFFFSLLACFGYFFNTPRNFYTEPNRAAQDGGYVKAVQAVLPTGVWVLTVIKPGSLKIDSKADAR